ncbi:MAG TPA: NAD(P)H-dependent glycerol-3-phosphate dehydrogenase [Acidimicrobiales bacterium]|nr:NAD(P)H-dependent glycerol-3-phosphate dehydrogenase [Acidimicrobiales bacterium]
MWFDAPVQVSVLGAGSWGTTVASLCAPGHPTVLWARTAEVAERINRDHVNPAYVSEFRLAPELRATSDLDEAVAGCDLLVVGVPAAGFRDIARKAGPGLRPWVPVVSLAKGLEPGSLLRMTEVVREELPGHPAAALTGPNLAREILRGQAAASVIATEDLALGAAIQGVLGRGVFRVYLNHDVIGCELGGALKNVIAIAAGIAQGLRVGDNTRAAVIARGLAEITRLGVAMGAEPATFAGLAGMGDLIATCMSPLSRNRAVGERLGQGVPLGRVLEELQMVAEGVQTAAAALELGRRHDLDLPICRAVHGVVTGRVTPQQAYRGLTPAGHEADPG